MKAVNFATTKSRRASQYGGMDLSAENTFQTRHPGAAGTRAEGCSRVA